MADHTREHGGNWGAMSYSVCSVLLRADILITRLSSALGMTGAEVHGSN